eukprot:3784283-Amphidinium_carterae.1
MLLFSTALARASLSGNWPSNYLTPSGHQEWQPVSKANTTLCPEGTNQELMGGPTSRTGGPSRPSGRTASDLAAS